MACLLREVKEETGAELSIGRLCWVREFVSVNHEYSWLNSDSHQVEVFFKCELADDSEVGMGDRPAENVHVLWLPEAGGRMAFSGRLVE